MTDYEIMCKIWNEQGRPEYVDYGGKNYRVFTPNGASEPVFVPQNTDALYGQTSTSLMAGDGVKRKPAKPGGANQYSDIGGEK